MRRTGPAGVLVPALALVLSLAGCGAGPQVLDTDGGAHVLVGGSSRGGEDALITGTLALVGRCVGIVDEQQTPYVVVWPTGTEPAGDGLALDVPDLGRVEAGEVVQLGGGVHRPPFADEVPDLPGGCPGAEVAVANSDQSR